MGNKADDMLVMLRWLDSLGMVLLDVWASTEDIEECVEPVQGQTESLARSDWFI